MKTGQYNLPIALPVHVPAGSAATAQWMMKPHFLVDCQPYGTDAYRN